MKAKKIVLVGVVICLALCAVGAGIMLMEPSHCALCEAPESDVPCVIDLHSGEIAELRISADELSDDPSTFVFSFMNVLGNTGYRDTGARLCKVTLPQDNLRLSLHRFCRDCREKLQGAGKYHYAVLDTESKTVYPLKESNFTIGDYSVTITKEENGMCVTMQSNR